MKYQNLVAWIGVVVILLFSTVGYTVERAMKQDQLVQFHQEIELAKESTGNPCGTSPVRMVVPPKGLDERPVLVLMGRDATALQTGLAFEATEPIPGEHAVRVVWNTDTLEYSEFGWLATGTKACKAGLSEAIKAYAKFNPPRGESRVRPPWPTPK